MGTTDDETRPIHLSFLDENMNYVPSLKCHTDPTPPPPTFDETGCGSMQRKSREHVVCVVCTSKSAKAVYDKKRQLHSPTL